MSGRAARAVAVAAAMVAAAGLSGCRTPPPGQVRAAQPGLTVTIDQPVAGGPGVAQVDDRRALGVPAAGDLDLAGVAAELELDSVLLESVSRPGSLRVERCALLDHAEALTSGWLLGRAAAVTTVGGAEVSGVVVEVGAPVALVTVDGEPAEVPLRAVTPLTTDPSVAAPAVGSAIVIDTPRGPRAAAMQGTSVESLVLHDATGTRHALRTDAIARLRVPELAPSPTLRCRVRTSSPGRHVIRLAYRTSAARWRAGYQIAAVDDATTAIALTARYTVELGGLRGPGGEAAPADVVLRALPAADDAAAIVVWRGPVALGDATITVVGPATTRPARVRRWYRGAAVTEGSDPRARGWGQGSRAEVWRELVFARAAEDVPGELRVAIADGQGGRRWLTGALALAPLGGRAVVRVPLDVDPSLVGFRARLIHDDGEGLADEVRLSVANRGAAPVRVILEEPLRPIGRAAVRFAAPAPGTLSAAVWQLEVEVAPGGLERAAVLLQYPALP